MRGSQKNKNYKVKWSSNFAYAVGLITADGNLSKDGRHIEFTSKDIELVKTFKKCLNVTDVKIGTKTSSFTDKKYPRIQFSNVKLYKYLTKIGLMPNKSKFIGALKIPNKYFFDFLRGCFDGDGSSYSYWDKRWHSSFMFYTNFTSGSLKHIEWLRNRLQNLLQIKGSIIKNNRAWTLRYAKSESKTLISKMYYKKNLPCLKRKHDKLKSVLKIDQLEFERENKRILKKAQVLELVYRAA